MTTYLIYPPFADPTQPYGALPALKGFLKARDLDATVVDLNVAAAHYLLDRDRLAIVARGLSDRFLKLNDRHELDVSQQLEYLSLIRARAAAVRCLASNARPLETFRDAEGFYDIRRYRQARNFTEDAFLMYQGAHFPYHFHFNQAAHVAVPWGIDLLEHYCKQNQSPLVDLYRSAIAQWRLTPGDVVGISLTFTSQIPETFYLLHLIRNLAPGVFTLLGGSCLQQILRHAPEATRRWIVSMADGACLGEGEACLCQLLAALATFGPTAGARKRFAHLADVPNLLLKAPGSDRLHCGPLQQTDMGRLPEPDFSDLALDRYLSPEPTLLFAPTRGCHWNRCSFCDYGLNRSGCHGYREMPAAEAARQLVGLCARHGVDHVYLSVDVLSPRYAEALARELLALQADIRWSSDFRIDPYYSRERCAMMFESGLRSAAFGIESGSDRLLKLMHKGITTDMIRKVNAHFHQAGIATAWMTFSGHPGETRAEALRTVRFIKDQGELVDLFILGRFGLTSGAEICLHPRQYGIRRVYYCRGDDFRLFPLYELDNDRSGETSQDLEQRIAQLSGGYYLDHYPWAGAISTHHSLLYTLKFGQRVFHRLRAPAGPKSGAFSKAGRRLPKGLTATPCFELSELEEATNMFFEDFWSSALAMGKDGAAPLSHEFFIQKTRISPD